jgi:hypothetical protein
MGRIGVTLTGIATVLVLSGCGGASHKAASTTARTTTAGTPSTAALPPGAPPALRGVFGRVLNAGQLAGFAPHGRRVLGVNATNWVAEEELPPPERAKEAARLQRLGFVAAVSERLAPTNGGAAEGLSVVEQFRSAQAAGAELAAQVKMAEAQGAKAFAVPAIPGASGFGGAHSGNTGYNVAFAGGAYYYLVGAGWPTGTSSPPTRAALITAAEDLYRRVHG